MFISNDARVRNVFVSQAHKVMDIQISNDDNVDWTLLDTDAKDTTTVSTTMLRASDYLTFWAAVRNVIADDGLAIVYLEHYHSDGIVYVICGEE